MQAAAAPRTTPGSPTPAATTRAPSARPSGTRTDERDAGQARRLVHRPPADGAPHPRSSPGSSPGSPGALVRRAVYRLVADRPETRPTRALQQVGVAPSAADRRRPPPGGAGRTSISTVVASTVTVLIWVDRHAARARRARHQPGPADRRRRHRRRRPRLRRPEPRQGLRLRAVHADRGPVRHRRRRRPRRGDRGRSSGSRCARPCCAARTARCGTSRTARSGASATAPSCGRSPCVDVVVAYDADLEADPRRSSTTSPRPGVRVGGLRRRRARRARAARRRVGRRRTSVTLRLLVKTAPGAQFRLQRALREAIKRRPRRAGIDAPGRPGARTRPPSAPP